MALDFAPARLLLAVAAAPAVVLLAAPGVAAAQSPPPACPPGEILDVYTLLCLPELAPHHGGPVPPPAVNAPPAPQPRP